MGLGIHCHTCERLILASVGELRDCNERGLIFPIQNAIRANSARTRGVFFNQAKTRIRNALGFSGLDILIVFVSLLVIAQKGPGVARQVANIFRAIYKNPKGMSSRWIGNRGINVSGANKDNIVGMLRLVIATYVKDVE